MYAMRTDGNRLSLAGSLTGSASPIVAAMHEQVRRLGYNDILINFSDVSFAAPSVMLPLIARVLYYRRMEVGFQIVCPTDDDIFQFFKRSNWLNLLAPERFGKTQHDRVSDIPAKQYHTAEEHFSVINDTMNIILGATPGLNRPKLAALEWALNEITDNVLSHAQSPIGGILQVVRFPRRRIIEFHVVDAGISIPVSLRTGKPHFVDDPTALGSGPIMASLEPA